MREDNFQKMFSVSKLIFAKYWKIIISGILNDMITPTRTHPQIDTNNETDLTSEDPDLLANNSILISFIKNLLPWKRIKISDIVF